MGWLRSLWLGQQAARVRDRRSASRTHLCLESLEDRWLPAVDITEFAIPTSSASALGITAGPDGNFWFTELTGGTNDKIGRITPTGAATEFVIPRLGGNPTIPMDPEAITAGPDGNLWFTARLGNFVGRVTPDGAITEFPLSIPNSQPMAITAGPDGNLWFTQRTGQIGRITPGGVVTEFAVPQTGDDPRGLAAGPDGNLWFTEFRGKIGRLTRTGTLTEFTVPTANSQPGAITAGPDGNLWFIEANAQKIGQITPSGTVTEFSVAPANLQHSGITAGPDGSIWFTDGNHKIGRITPTGTVTELPSPTPVTTPVSIALGPQGTLAFTDQAQIGVIHVLPSGVLNVNERYIQALYQDFVGQADFSVGVDLWQQSLVSHGAGGVVQGIELSALARTSFVHQLYQNYLGRDTGPLEEQGFVKALAGGATQEQVSAAILGSPEFFNRAPLLNGVGAGTLSNSVSGPPTNQTFVQGLFHELLNRAASPDELDNFVNHLLPKLGRQGLALVVLTSSEYRTLQVQQYFVNFLHRPTPPSGAEINVFVNSSLGLGAIQVAIEASNEKFNLSRSGADANDRFLQAVYQRALGRPAADNELLAWEQILLRSGAAPVVNGIEHSAEARARLVQQWYVALLGRNPAPGEAQNFVGMLTAGVAEEQVLKLIAGSTEFFLHAPQVAGVGGGTATNQTFVQALFEVLLNRPASSDDVNRFTNTVIPQSGRVGATLVLLTSTEFRNNAVRAFYQSDLRRQTPPKDADVAVWVNSKLGVWSIQVAFESSLEFVYTHGLSPALGERVRVGTMGDSLTDAYAKYTKAPNNWGSAGDQNWVEQLLALRGTNLLIENEALAGATSASLFNQSGPSTTRGQDAMLSTLVHNDLVDYGVLIIGTNDIANFLLSVTAGGSTDATLVVNQLVANIGTALDRVQAAGHVSLVVGNVPDIGHTPRFQTLFGTNSALATLASNVVTSVNQQIAALAAARGLAVLDLFGLSDLSLNPLQLGGVTVPSTKLFAPDQFQPGTVLQGLLANTFLYAEKIAYGVDTDALRLSDQDILAAAHLSASGGPTYFDVSPYVQQYSPPPPPAVLTLF